MARNPITGQSYDDPSDVFKKKPKLPVPTPTPTPAPTPKPAAANADAAFIAAATKGIAAEKGIDITGVTQAGLDAARAKGIDVFTGANLKKISEADIAAAENKANIEAALGKGALEVPQPEGENEVTAKKILDDVAAQEGTLQGIAPRGFRIFMRTAGEAGKQAIPAALEATADIISMAKKILPLTNKKLVSTMEAENTFNRGAAAMAADIELVKAGLKDKNETYVNLIMMKNALNKLEGKQKQIGQSNTLYWLKDGKEIEEDTIIFKQTLDRLEQELIMASVGTQF